MRRLLLPCLLLWPALACAAVVNVEFKFAPFTGDLAKNEVETVAGTARVSLNGVPLAEQEVRKQTVPVLFDEREIASALWIPVASMGPAVRKGKNTIRIEFDPENATAAYRTQLSWASVTDQTTEVERDGRRLSTNQADQGFERKDAKGRVVFERTFDAEFAKDLPWHHQSPVTALSDEEKQRILALVKQRADWFAPDFAKVYAALERRPQAEPARVRKARCLDAAYEAGLRVEPPAPADVEVLTTGQPEVVVRRKGGGALYYGDPKVFDRIAGEELQTCAGTALAAVYPPRLAVVRTPAGGWEVVY